MLEVFVIFLMVLATVAVAALVLAPRVAQGRLVFDVRPDRPHAFGYHMAWLAIRTRDTARVLAELRLQGYERANWRTGLGTVYSAEHGPSRLFVAPPVNGWTLVVGLGLPHPLGKEFVDKALPLLMQLGSQFIEVQYFLAHPPIDYFAWARIIDGKVVRAYAVGGDGVLWSRGKPTREERSLGQKLYEIRGLRKSRSASAGKAIVYPTEAHVMALAGRWSLDPTRLAGEATAEPGLGYIGTLPADWGPERLRKSA